MWACRIYEFVGSYRGKDDDISIKVKSTKEIKTNSKDDIYKIASLSR